jgi:N-acetylmuramoyl-L-alanine amidase
VGSRQGRKLAALRDFFHLTTLTLSRNLADTQGSSAILASVRALALTSCLLLALAPGSAFAAAPARSLTVALDPGHGGAFPHDGAHGRGGLAEKDVALAVAHKLKSILERSGASVVLTRERDQDVPLAQRAQIANESSADLFLSIHCNSMESSEDRKVTRGVETYFLSPDPTDAEAKLLAELENGGPAAMPASRTADPVSGILADLALTQARSDSAALARIVQRNIVRGSGSPSRGVRQAPFLVLSGTKMPSALVEIGFISHPAEGRLLSQEQHQERLAEALAAAVEEFAEQVLARRLLADGDRAKVILPELTLDGKTHAKARPAAAKRPASPASNAQPPPARPGTSPDAPKGPAASGGRATIGAVVGALGLPVAAASAPR